MPGRTHKPDGKVEPKDALRGRALLGDSQRTVTLSSSISVLGLSARAINSLKGADILTIEQLTKMTRGDLSRVKHLGVKTQVEIWGKLTEAGFALKFEGTPPASLSPGDSIDELRLSNRARNSLRGFVSTIGELTQKREIDLLKRKGLGKRTLNEIKAKLAEYGFSLRKY